MVITHFAEENIQVFGNGVLPSPMDDPWADMLLPGAG